MAQRRFIPDDQLDFAKLSGDFNPLHLDPVLARRLLYGEPIVHGLHALLWSVDQYLKTSTRSLELRVVKANFQAGIGLGQTVKSKVISPSKGQIEIQLETDEKHVGWFQLSWVPASIDGTNPLSGSPQKPEQCRERDPAGAAMASGELPLHFDHQLAARLFPNLIRMLPPIQLAVLLATTRLVGMECPGLHSIFSGLDLKFTSDWIRIKKLNYRAARFSERLALLLMDVEAPGVNGQIKSFFRPKPQAQAGFTDICREVESEEFSGQRALVIGGSRGLGEVTAKLLAAGGARVTITYFQSQREVQHIVDEINTRSSKAVCLPLNVLNPSPGLLVEANNQLKPLYLYYFASPFIFGAAKGRFSPRRYATFSEYYVTGFLRTVQAVRDPSIGLQKIFYPSTSAIDELPLDMGEYAAAKMAGEVLCDFLQKTNPALTIHKPRLPRIATDQTVSLLPAGNQDPVPVLLSNLRHLREM